MQHLYMPRLTVAGVCAVAVFLGVLACRRSAPEAGAVSSIVGTWLVKTPEAPFAWHLYAFHPDGTVQQANPDAGDPNTSDSNAMGAWQVEGDHIKGRIVEFTANRTTHQVVSRGEISFTLRTRGDTLSGLASAAFYDIDGHPLHPPIAATLNGQRIRP